MYLSRELNAKKAENGMQMFKSLRNMMQMNCSFNAEKARNYFNGVFCRYFKTEECVIENPSRARLLGAGQCIVWRISFHDRDISIDLKHTVDFSWMINDGESIVYRNTFLPYEARLTVKINGMKKEYVLTDTEYLSDKLTWNVETAFEDRGIRRIAEDVEKSVQRMKKKRARNMMQGVGMDLYA